MIEALKKLSDMRKACEMCIAGRKIAYLSAEGVEG